MKGQKIYSGFNRLRDFPLDVTSVYETYNELVEYITNNKTAYTGQLCVVKNGEKAGLYEIRKDTTNLYPEAVAYGKEVAKVASDVVELAQQLDTEVQNIENTRIELNDRMDTIETSMDSFELDYVTKTQLSENLREILGAKYEELDDELNSIYEIAAVLKRVVNNLLDESLQDLINVQRSLDNIRAEIQQVSINKDIAIADANARINAVDADLQEAKSRILSPAQVIEIVKRDGLDNVSYMRQYAFNQAVNPILRDTSEDFLPNCTITEITLNIKSITVAQSGAKTVSFYIDNQQDEYIPVLDDYNGGNSIYDIPVFDNGIGTYKFDGLNFKPIQSGKFCISVGTAVSNFSGNVQITYLKD